MSLPALTTLANPTTLQADTMATSTVDTLGAQLVRGAMTMWQFADKQINRCNERYKYDHNNKLGIAQ